MIEAAIAILVVGLILFLVFYGAGKFMSGTPLQIVGIILGLIFILYALNRLGFSDNIKL